MKQSQSDRPGRIRNTDPLDVRHSHIAPKQSPRAGQESWYEDFGGGSKRTSGQVLRGVYRRAQESDLGLLAGGVAFFFFLALIPMLAAAVSLWALVSDPVSIESHFSVLKVVLPQRAFELISSQLRQIAAGSPQSLSWGLALSLAVSLWSVKKGMDALIRATNAVYQLDEQRGFFARAALAIGLSLGAVVMLLLLLGVSVALPTAASLLSSDPELGVAVSWARWPVMLLMMLVALGVLYKAAPHRRLRFRLASPGAVFATVVWIAASFGFSMYVENFGRYNETLGALGGVAIMLVWLWISAAVVLLGAAINAETGALKRMNDA